MVRENFQASIKELKNDVIEMMNRVEDITNAAMEALINQDIKLAREVMKMDDAIDILMYDIEEKAIELIALQQPMAKDLRVIFSIAKMITDLERVGDFCVNISKEVIKIGDEELIKPLVDIPKMKSIIVEMIQNMRESFVNENAALAKKVGADDELIDNLYLDIYNDILLMINQDSKYINQGTKLLFIGRYLERMADHITNVCEKIIYIVKGDRVSIN